MRFIKKSREYLGTAKFYLIDHWPYLRHRTKAIAACERLNLSFERLEPLPINGRYSMVEVHMLCGKAHRDMAKWASWSLLRFLPGANLFVHSDGSLALEDCEQWQQIIPNFSLSSRSDRDALVEAKLSKTHPLLCEWRKRHIYGSKFIDPHLYGKSDNILLLLDSDVLCFNEPGEIINSLESKSNRFAWHEDIKSSYVSSTATLNALLDVEIPDRFNSGFLLSSRFSHEVWARANNDLHAMQKKSLDIFHPWVEQTLYALVAARHPSGRALPNRYSIYYGKTRIDAIIRHYVGVLKIRPRFFLEGVPLILNQLGGSPINQDRISSRSLQK